MFKYTKKKQKQQTITTKQVQKKLYEWNLQRIRHIICVQTFITVSYAFIIYF